MLSAANNQWKMQIQRDKNVAALRGKPLLFTVEFDEIFEGQVATGVYAQTVNNSSIKEITVDPSLQENLFPISQSTLPASNQEDQEVLETEDQTPQTVAKKRHACSALSVPTPPLKRQKKTGGQFMGTAISGVGEEMRRSTLQREKDATQREIEEAQRIKKTPQAIIAKALALLQENTDTEDGDFICDAADIFLDEKKAYMYITLSDEVRDEWLQRQITMRKDK